MASLFSIRSVAKRGSWRMLKRVFETYKEGLDRRSAFRALNDCVLRSTSAELSDSAAGVFGRMTEKV